MKLPLIELQINEDEDTLVHTVSIVQRPAIESNFLAFKSEKDTLHFSYDDTKRELIGAALIPDIKIYRRNPEQGDYYCFFTKDTIRKIAQVFFKNGFTNNMNVEHTDKSAESFVFQSYIVDSAMGMNAPKGIDVPDGSWIIGVKVNSDSLWNDIKTGKKHSGFSVEGLFKMIDTHRSVEFESADEDISDEEFESALLAFSNALNMIK